MESLPLPEPVQWIPEGNFWFTIFQASPSRSRTKTFFQQTGEFDKRSGVQEVQQPSPAKTEGRLSENRPKCRPVSSC